MLRKNKPSTKHILRFLFIPLLLLLAFFGIPLLWGIVAIQWLGAPNWSVMPVFFGNLIFLLYAVVRWDCLATAINLPCKENLYA
jgi:hypothetical protein